MKNSLAAFVVGVLFAVGLGVAGMTQPQKVIGFLNLFGQWDPSLIFVMVGAIAVHVITYALIRKRAHPIFDEHWHVPTKTKITPALIIGSFIFGVGWALAGYCPGPAIAAVVTYDRGPLTFLLFMFIGMLLFRLVDRRFKFNK